MAFKIIWSQEATVQFNNVIEYLEKNWSEREIDNFVNNTFEKLEMVSINPMLARKSFSETTREILITPQNLLVFKIDYSRNQINILSVWDTRQHPKTKKG